MVDELDAFERALEAERQEELPLERAPGEDEATYEQLYQRERALRDQCEGRRYGLLKALRALKDELMATEARAKNAETRLETARRLWLGLTEEKRALEGAFERMRQERDALKAERGRAR